MWRVFPRYRLGLHTRSCDPKSAGRGRALRVTPHPHLTPPKNSPPKPKAFVPGPPRDSLRFWGCPSSPLHSESQRPQQQPPGGWILSWDPGVHGALWLSGPRCSGPPSTRDRGLPLQRPGPLAPGTFSFGPPGRLACLSLPRSVYLTSLRPAHLSPSPAGPDFQRGRRRDRPDSRLFPALSVQRPAPSPGAEPDWWA